MFKLLSKCQLSLSHKTETNALHFSGTSDDQSTSLQTFPLIINTHCDMTCNCKACAAAAAADRGAKSLRRISKEETTFLQTWRRVAGLRHCYWYWAANCLKKARGAVLTGDPLIRVPERSCSSSDSHCMSSHRFNTTVWETNRISGTYLAPCV